MQKPKQPSPSTSSSSPPPASAAPKQTPDVSAPSTEPVKVASLADVPSGSQLVEMSMGGVVLWREGEVLTREERERRTMEALRALGQV